MTATLQPRPPSLPIPPPLRGAEIGSFAHDTITRRLPNIARQTLVENDFDPETIHKIQALIDDMPGGQIRPLNDPGAPDSAAWERCLAPRLGQTWLEAPWFFVEAYFYRRLLEATGYFQYPVGQRPDHFSHQKQQGLSTSVPACRALAAHLPGWLAEPDRVSLFTRLFKMVLWGNQADLSVWPVGREAALPVGKKGQNLVLDESERIAAHFLNGNRPAPQVDFIIDNAGFELVSDLAAADVLLAGGIARQVYFHVKAHPTFVSDAMPEDVVTAAQALAADLDPETNKFGRRLQGYLANGQLALSANFFWTSPLSFWEMPPELLHGLAHSALVVSKGDANFRRWLGDCRWEESLPFHRVVDYFPAPLMALRVHKCDLVIGLQPEQIASLDAHDQHWRINGQTGMIVTNLPA